MSRAGDRLGISPIPENLRGVVGQQLAVRFHLGVLAVRVDSEPADERVVPEVVVPDLEVARLTVAKGPRLNSAFVGRPETMPLGLAHVGRRTTSDQHVVRTV
jgi:hypothetical protein